ncbi:MAG: TIGR01212 family radical SAM protein [Ruminococcaceae bacterium]|nr:TIGR01212 family radical SAM protein [Oscillospiraceae bacterium]
MRKHNNAFPYSDSNKRYHTFDYYQRRTFGGKCLKLPIDGGFSCPNRDGTVGERGCIFCSEKGSGDFTLGRAHSITEQMEHARASLSAKWESERYIAYFQSFSGTYAPLPLLKERYEEALRFPGTVGLDIATRPDCLPDEVIDYLSELNERTDLTVELGLQSFHDATLAFIRRGHSVCDFLAAYRRLAERGIKVCVHIIDGLPGETKEMMLETADRLASLRPFAVKIHLLHVLKNTPLAELYETGGFACLSLEQYADIVVSQLERLPAETVIGRVTGDGERSALIAPLWSLKKLVVINEIDKLMVKRDTFQGKFVKMHKN